MIRYALSCHEGHEFEAWFRSSSDYDRQAAASLVVCPACGSDKVDKALMAPALGKDYPAPAPETAAAGSPEATPTGQPAPTQTHALTADPRARALVETVRRLRKYVAENADYVGPRFAEEARRIHHGEEAEPRSIYGEASADDAKELIEEGIDILPLPRLPDDQN